MRATIRPRDDDSSASVAVDGEAPVRVFRVPDRGEEVVATKDGQTVPLEVRDLSVSREYDNNDEPGYIEFYTEDTQLYVRDTGSSSETKQCNAFGEIELQPNDPTLITGDCTIEIGYSTELEVEVTRASQLTSAIPHKADLVAKISGVRSINEVESELVELRDMMRSEPDPDEQYKQRLDDVETALSGLRAVSNERQINTEQSLSEQGRTETQQTLEHTARRVKNYFLNN
jgi:uncharacterized damage-inducible protein DinB